MEKPLKSPDLENRGGVLRLPGLYFNAFEASLVAVAQLVELRIVIPAVAGSIPVSHPTSTFQLSILILRLVHLSEA